MRVNSLARGFICQSMIRESGYRFSEKIMLKQKDRAGWRFEEKPSRSRSRAAKKPGARVAGSLAFSFGRNFPTARGRAEAKRPR
jgi:hypothetical protein